VLLVARAVGATGEVEESLASITQIGDERPGEGP
jgi:hypothetical protein